MYVADLRRFSDVSDFRHSPTLSDTAEFHQALIPIKVIVMTFVSSEMAQLRGSLHWHVLDPIPTAESCTHPLLAIQSKAITMKA